MSQHFIFPLHVDSSRATRAEAKEATLNDVKSFVVSTKDSFERFILFYISRVTTSSMTANKLENLIESINNLLRISSHLNASFARELGTNKRVYLLRKTVLSIDTSAKINQRLKINLGLPIRILFYYSENYSRDAKCKILFFYSILN